jgi:hypothetical protein
MQKAIKNYIRKTCFIIKPSINAFFLTNKNQIYLQVHTVTTSHVNEDYQLAILKYVFNVVAHSKCRLVIKCVI